MKKHVWKNKPKVEWHSYAKVQNIVDDLVAARPTKEIMDKHGVSRTFVSRCRTKYCTVTVSRNDVPIERRLPDEPELPLNLFKDG